MIYEGVVYDQDMLPVYRARYSSRDKAYETQLFINKKILGRVKKRPPAFARGLFSCSDIN